MTLLPKSLKKKRYSLIQPQCHYQKFWLFNIDAKLLLNSLFSNFTNCLDIFYYNNFCSSNPGSHITFIFHVSLVSLNWRQFLQPFIVSHGVDGFVFWVFVFFYEYRVIVDRMSLIWVSFFFSLFFFLSVLMAWFRLHILGRNTMSVRLCLSLCQYSHHFLRVSPDSIAQDFRTAEWQCNRKEKHRVQKRNTVWLLPLCPGLGWLAGPRAQLLFQADTHHCFRSPGGFSELHMTTSYKPSLHYLDLCMGWISKATFSLFCFGWFHRRQHPSARELMKPAGWCKATWHSGRLLLAHPHP